MINSTIFRAYDIRGIYPDDLNEEAVSRITKAFAHLYPKAKTIVVARDPRLSSPALIKEIIKALVGSGKQVLDLGIAPDPLFYFAIFNKKLDGGIMLSGSHNPKEYNGLTMHIRKGNQTQSQDVIGKDLEKIKEMVLSGKEPSFAKAMAGKQEGSVQKLDLVDEYIDYVSGKVSLNKPLKIIIDVANGACSTIPEKIFKKLGCEVKTLFADYNGNFPNHLPDPYEEENLKDLQKAVIKEGADIGFAFDTDGDRVMPIDNQGRAVTGDFCLLMLAQQALNKQKGQIAHCMRVSKAFLDQMAEQGIKTHFTVSHHSAVIDKIIETDAVFGGEITMHFLFPLDYYLCDEAFFSALKIAEIAAEKNDFAKYVDSLPRYFASPEIFIPAPDDKKFQIIKKLQNYLRENNYNFIDVDGARINFPNGWALARAANTSPFIKCRFEGETEKDLKEITKKSLEIFKRVGIPIKKQTYNELGL